MAHLRERTGVVALLVSCCLPGNPSSALQMSTHNLGSSLDNLPYEGIEKAGVEVHKLLKCLHGQPQAAGV